MNVAADLIPIEVIANLKTEEYYCLTAQQELYFLTKTDKTKIIANEHTSITRSSLKLNPNYNFILLEKIRGEQKDKLIFGNHLFTYDAEHYNHGLLLVNSSIISSETNSKQANIFLTSPLIGVQKMAVCLNSQKQSSSKQAKLKNDNCFEIVL